MQSFGNINLLCSFGPHWLESLLKLLRFYNVIAVSKLTEAESLLVRTF